MKPELLPAMKILARFRHNLADRHAVDCAREIEHGVIAHRQLAVRHVHKVRRLVAQPFDRRVHFGFIHCRIRQLHRNVFVIREVEFRRRYHSGLESHGTIIAKFHVAHIRQRNHPQLLFFNRFPITFRNQRLGQLVLDFLAKLPFDHLLRRPSRPVTGDPRIARIIARDRVPFLAHHLRRQFDPQRRYAVRFVFHFHFH